MTRIGIGAALIAVSLFSVTAAKAQSDIMMVRVSDLNTSSPQGAEIALRRIKNASTLFCGDFGQSHFHPPDRSPCAAKRSMTDKAYSSLNASTVTALHKGQSSSQLASRDAH